MDPPSVSGRLTRDGWLLFATRCSRMFAYGLLSVVLVLYLVEVGLKEWEVGLLLTLTLAGDTAISLWLTTTADRLGRRRTLILGAVLMVLAGVVFVSTGNFLLLVVAATVGVISPSGNEIGPFLSVEQAALSHIVSDERRTDVFAWYNLVGSFSTALGALAGGLIAGGVTALRPDRSRRLPPGAAGLRRHRRGADRRVCVAVPGGRSDEGRVPPAAQGRAGTARVPEDGIQAVAAVRPGCVRRRVRHPEHHRLLVPRPVRPRPGDARHGLPVRQPAGRASRRWPLAGSPGGSGW